jgi:HAD superfamily hydrolase (TIGR01450 family)
MTSTATAPAGPFDLANYDACVFDLDGTVWLGATDPIPGAADFLQRCRDDGKRIAYATNAIVHAPETLSDRLCEAGLAQPGEPVVTSGSVITRTLAALGVERVAAVVPEALATSLAAAGIQVLLPDELGPDDFGPVDASRALVMASFRQATIGSIERLGRLAVAGHPLFLSSRDPGFPVTGGIEPGGGVLFNALTTMYDVTAIVLGKPSPEYAAAVADAVGGVGARIAMIGDSQRADIGIAVELGCDSVLLTGYSVRPIDPALPVPTFVAATLAHAFEPYGGR